jgi:hypothetical protein
LGVTVARGVWVYVGGRGGNKPSPNEKGTITAACDKFIADVLVPRFLPEIRPSEKFNYPIALCGKWHGNKYRFFTRYRSDGPRSAAPEFDAPFARLDYVSRDLFDLSWHRHTGEWVCVFQRLSLAEALHLIESEPYFAPC